jgi:hypothetical protein
MTMLDYRVQTIEHHLWPGTSPVPRGNTPEWDRRKHVDPLKEFDPEDTDHGSTKLPPGMFAALRQKVTRLETEKSEADAFAAGQENARRDQEKASARRWTNTLRWIKVLVPLIAIVFGGIGYLIKHSIDAPQREKIEQQNERLKQLDK